MKVAPKNFRPDMVLGEGGFGKVFKGWLDEKGTWKTGIGTPIVVKKLNSEGWQGFEEWDKVERTSESESTASDEVIGVPYDNLAPLSDDIAESKQLLDKLVVVKFNGASGKNMGFSGARIRDGGR